MNNYMTRAEQAETRGDFARAKMWWFYAAHELTGNPRGLRTYYCQREDQAAAKAEKAARLPYPWCKDPEACAVTGYCTRNPSCGD